MHRESQGGHVRRVAIPTAALISLLLFGGETLGQSWTAPVIE